MTQDYYDVLGVSRNATNDEVRRAFRQKARELHPDVNHDDPDAESRFKTINEAYEVLRDPAKRSAYDRFGQAGVRGFGGRAAGPGVSDFGDLGDLFEQFFGFGTGARARPRSRAVDGADVRVRLKLTFEEAVFGTTRRVEVIRHETCEACTGSGAAPGTSPTRCGTCNGTGEVRQAQQTVFGQFVNVQPCRACGGEGEVVRSPCPDCDGNGRVRRERQLDVDIPAGVEDGLQIRLAGEGHHGRHGGSPGNLYVALRVTDHPSFTRDGTDLHLQLGLNPADAALGAEVEVPTLDGEPSSLRIPAGTQTGDTFRLPELGVPHLRRSGRGELVVTVFVMTPEKLSREQKDLLEQLRSTLPEATVMEPNKGTWWKRLRERLR